MPRWEADGKSRLERAALDLFSEQGYDATTVSAIAKRAGLTERSFYRYFADKREVLFGGGETLAEHLVAAITAAPADLGPYAALLAAMRTGDTVFLDRDEVRRRAAVIARSPALAERELIKLTHMSESLVQALIARGVDSARARAVTDLGMSVFRAASQQRLATDAPFADLIDEAVAEQRRTVLEVDQA